MQGPKLRIGNLKDGEVMLNVGQRFRLDLDETPGDDQRAPLPHPEIFAALSAGTSLLIDDGKLRLEVQDCTSSHAETRVVTGGPLRNHKGVRSAERGVAKEGVSQCSIRWEQGHK